MSEHIPLSVSRYKSKNFKISQKWKVKQLKFSDMAKKSERKNDKCLHGSLHLKRGLSKKEEESPFLYRVSIYLFLNSLSFFKDIILFGNRNCQSMACIDHACWILIGVLFPVTGLPKLVPLNSNTVKDQWLVPYGLGWLGIHSLDVVLLKCKTHFGTVAECVLPWKWPIIPKTEKQNILWSVIQWISDISRTCLISFRKIVIGVPFRTQVCPPQVWVSL